MKNKHRIKQCLSLLLAGGIALTNLGAALPAFADDAATTPETAQTATLDPDAAVLYADLPDAPVGSYIGSEGLPVATGQTKISLSLWADGQLEKDSHLDPDALNNGDKIVTVPLTEDTDYAIVPLMAQVEYPADGSRTDVLLPEDVTLLDYYGNPRRTQPFCTASIRKPLPLPQGCICRPTEISRRSLSTLPRTVIR